MRGPQGSAMNIRVEVNSVINDHASLDATTAAVLHELESMLEALVSSGVTNSMDLRRAPLAPKEYRQLKTTLGEGEVSAEIDSSGRTHVYETAVPGVWWVRHCNHDGKTLGEFIEVTACPEILESQPEDLRSAASRLRARISQQLQRTPDPKDIVRSLKALGLSERAIMKNPKLNPLTKGGNGNAE